MLQIEEAKSPMKDQEMPQAGAEDSAVEHDTSLIIEQTDEGFNEEREDGKTENESTTRQEDAVMIRLDKDDKEGVKLDNETGGEVADDSIVNSVVNSVANSIVDRLKKAKKRAMPQVKTWLSCPVCCEKVASRSLLLKHMQLHRVWVLRTWKGIALEGVQGVYDALNLRMPNIPQGLTDRETGLAIRDVLVQKTTPDGIAVPQPEEHFGTNLTESVLSTTEVAPDQNGINYEATFQPNDQLNKEAELSTIDQSMIRNLVTEDGAEDTEETDKLDITGERDVIYKTVQKIVQDIKIKQLVGGTREAENNAVSDGETGEGSDTTFLCPFCVTVFQNSSDCYEHVTSNHSMIAAFQCIHKGCRQVFAYVHDYERHTEIHKQTAFICRVCNVHFETMLDAVSHKSSAHRMHHGDVNRCDLCNKTFASKELLSKHVASDAHHHQCDQCGKVSARP